MFRRILIPLDLSEKDRHAADAAAELAGEGGTLVLLHVIETLQDVSFEEMEPFYRSLRERAEAELAARADALAARGLEVRREIAYGKRGPEIVRCAEQLGADLIVLSSHRFDPERPAAGFGTISHQVAVLASCPVLLLR